METRFHFVDIDVKTSYLAQDSQPGQAQYVFSYTVTIKNTGAIAAQLLRRHWIITDANGMKIEVLGEGVSANSLICGPVKSFNIPA